MSLLLYVVTRAILALVALMAVDVITENAYVADPWNILAAGVLIVVADIIAYTNSRDATDAS